MPEEPQRNETTNAVLKATIDGLAKLTDTQLEHVNETLKDLKTLMSGFATKAEVDEKVKDIFASIKRIEDAFIKHNEDDKSSFGSIEKTQGQLRDTLLRWGAILGFILLVFSFSSPIILHYWLHF